MKLLPFVFLLFISSLGIGQNRLYIKREKSDSLEILNSYRNLTIEIDEKFEIFLITALDTCRIDTIRFEKILQGVKTEFEQYNSEISSPPFTIKRIEGEFHKKEENANKLLRSVEFYVGERELCNGNQVKTGIMDDRIFVLNIIREE